MELTTKREIVLGNIPSEHCVTVPEIAHRVAKNEGLHYDNNTIKKTVELLRKDGSVKINNRAGADGMTVIRVNCGASVVRMRKPEPKEESGPLTASITPKHRAIAAIESVTESLLKLAEQMDDARHQIEALSECDLDEMERLRAFRRKFRELFDEKG